MKEEKGILPVNSAKILSYTPQIADLEDLTLSRSIEKYDQSLESGLLVRPAGKICDLTSIARTAESFNKKLELERERKQSHSVVVKEETITPLEIVLKETPWKQWYTTGKTLGSLATIGAKVALQLLKNKNNEKLFKKLRLYEIEIVRLKLFKNADWQEFE